jgi:ribose/xylose/arabinose/galactoside ABC-type transport system permease subunit
MLGALGGVLLLSTIDRGLNLMRVSVFWVKVIQGLIIMLAMFIDAQRVRYRTPHAKASVPSAAETSNKTA